MIHWGLLQSHSRVLFCSDKAYRMIICAASSLWNVYDISGMRAELIIGNLPSYQAAKEFAEASMTILEKILTGQVDQLQATQEALLALIRGVDGELYEQASRVVNTGNSQGGQRKLYIADCLDLLVGVRSRGGTLDDGIDTLKRLL